MKKTDSLFVFRCILVTVILLFIAWYVLCASGLIVSVFFRESINLYGIIAFVLALFSLWYTYQAYESQRRTEVNTENVPVDHQKKKFEGLSRHEYRNLVCILATAIRFFDKKNGTEKSRNAYPSESNILKLQAEPEDFVLDINAQMASSVSEMRLLLRNANIEIQVAIEHLSRHDINDDTLYQDYDNLIYKPLYLVKRACEMETLLTDERNQKHVSKTGKNLLRELIERSIRIMVGEHLKKLPESLQDILTQDEDDHKNQKRRNCLAYLQLMSMSHDLNFKDIDHTGALLRSFNFLLKDSDDNKTSIQVTTDFAPFRWDFDENISMNIDKILSQLSIIKQNNTKHHSYLNNYQQLLDEFKTEKMLDFVAFFPAMVLLDAIVETRKIGMVNYCKL